MVGSQSQGWRWQQSWAQVMPWVLGCALLIGSFVLYARTAAPSVLAGDSAEFQFAAPLGGVPHPTGYPLYMMLGKLATLGNPSDVAHRVTLVSSLLAAATVAILGLLILRLTGRAMAALVGGLALAVAPGLWNAATIAEVYSLNVLLLVVLAWVLVRASGDRVQASTPHPPAPSPPMGRGRSASDAVRRSPIVQQHQKYVTPPRRRGGAGGGVAASVDSHLPKNSSTKWLYAAAFITGLGFSHHGSFAFIGVPLFLGSGVWWLWQLAHESRRVGRSWLPDAFVLVGGCVVAGLLGLTPWLYLVVQYARFGPFVGIYHGLPRHYFWGAPKSWADVVNHLFGGVMRGGVFRIPDGPTLVDVAHALVRRLRFEFGTVGCVLGAVGCIALFWRNRAVWLGSCWVAGMTCLYFALLGQAVQDSIVFTLPLLLPWTLWIGCAVAAVYDVVLRFPRLQQGFHSQQSTFSVFPPKTQRPRRFWVFGGNHLALIAHLLACILLVVTIQWGQSRLPYGNKADQWLFHTFGAGVLDRVDPSAVVLVRWEQGTTLQYLRLVEGRRPDVTVDIVEPEDDPWPQRADERYPGRPVYIIGSDADAARTGAQFVWRTDYAELFRLR